MTRGRYSGLIGIGLLLFALVWAPTRIVAAPVPPRTAATGADGGRILYPPGHYPQLRLHDGEMHEVRSVLNVTRALTFGDYVWDAAGVPAGPVWVRIDLARQLLSVFRSGHEIGTAVIIYGAKSHPTPVGTFHILQKSQFYYSKTYDAPMPFALRLTADGVAMHASRVRERVATHGCIGLPLEFARLLYGATRQGDPVEILPDKMGA